VMEETVKFSKMFGECFPSDAEKKKSSEILRELFRDGGDRKSTKHWTSTPNWHNFPVTGSHHEKFSSFTGQYYWVKWLVSLLHTQLASSASPKPRSATGNRQFTVGRKEGKIWAIMSRCGVTAWLGFRLMKSLKGYDFIHCR
jgi:hypothetical protein